MSVPYLILFVASLPFLFVCCWSDLRNMTIPNRVNMAIFVIFVVLGVFLFPLPEYGIRLLQAVAMLAIGIFLTTAGLMGGGDSKLLAAGAPYVALAHMTEFFMALAVMSLAAVATHRILGKIPQFRNPKKRKQPRVQSTKSTWIRCEFQDRPKPSKKQALSLSSCAIFF